LSKYENTKDFNEEYNRGDLGKYNKNDGIRDNKIADTNESGHLPDWKNVVKIPSSFLIFICCGLLLADA